MEQFALLIRLNMESEIIISFDGGINENTYCSIFIYINNTIIRLF